MLQFGSGILLYRRRKCEFFELIPAMVPEAEMSPDNTSDMDLNGPERWTALIRINCHVQPKALHTSHS